MTLCNHVGEFFFKEVNMVMTGTIRSSLGGTGEGITVPVSGMELDWCSLCLEYVEEVGCWMVELIDSI